MAATLNSLRRRQINFCSRWLKRLSASPTAFRFIKAIRDRPVARRLLAAAIGHNRPFSSLREAEASVAGRDGGGHRNPACGALHLSISQRARPSDYPALFHLAPLMHGIRSVFDFGGSVGNIFYCYRNYLTYSPELRWTVYDLPEVLERGENIAKERRENTLKFTARFHDANGADLFMAYGSAHYFDMPLAQMLAELDKKPRFVLVNRTPLTDGLPFATVQDGPWLLPCMIYNREEFVRGFEKIGYEPVDIWPVPERSLILPGYPDRAVHVYSGMFFRLNAAPAPRVCAGE